MARDKERSINPAQQQRKLEKARALKKSRAELQNKRNEKLAKRNPDRVQRQIDDLKALEAAGDIKPREKAILEELEKDLKAIRKAKEALGETLNAAGGAQQRKDGTYNKSQVLGKRSVDGERRYPQSSFDHRRRESSGSDTDESIRRIPMPEDTPPPVPREFRRGRNFGISQQHDATALEGAQALNNTSNTRLSSVVESRTTYSSAPQIRDLKKEATSRFVPSVVQRRQDAVRGTGGQLLEPEELDRLEAAGYAKQNTSKPEAGRTSVVTDEAGSDNYDKAVARRFAEEERRFQEDLNSGDVSQHMHKQTVSNRPHHVELEEVEDEEG